MESNLKLIENIAENLENGLWSAAVDDILIIDRPRGLLEEILQHFKISEELEYYPISEKSERWLKAIARTLAGEYACGNL